MFTRTSRTVAAAAFGLAVAACSDTTDHYANTSPGTSQSAKATSGPDGMQSVTINSTNMFRFEPATISAHTGKLQVTLVDMGSYPHNLAVDSLHFTSKTVSGELGQNTTTFTLSFTKPGTYPFVCTFHSSAGMRGEFVIR